jgi:hypothetical protein
MQDRSTITYRALTMLHARYGPKLSGRAPFWRPEAPACAERVRVPSWMWQAPSPAQMCEELTILDATGAYLSAASSVEVAHGALQRTGAVPFDPRRPGYWLVEAHPWPAWDRIMSPLGGRSDARRSPGAVWLAGPTVQLLAQLTEAGHWPGVEVLDSWTADRPVRLRTWAAAIRDDRERHRAAACEHPAPGCCSAHERLESVKVGYAQAVVLMGEKDRSPVYRPDWRDAIRAQSAASIWRYAWRALGMGYRLAGAGHIDELVMPRPDVLQVWQASRIGRAVPFVLDLTGRRLGSFKVKAGRVPVAEWARG